MEKNKLYIYCLGKQDFERVTIGLQEYLLKKVSQEDGNDVLLLFEPASPIYTLGALAHGRSEEEFILRKNDAKIIDVSRGGSITYHGPGQIVGYPIIDLANRKYGCGGFMERFEQGMLSVVRDIGVKEAKIIPEPMDDPRVGKNIKKRQFAVWHQDDNGTLSKIVAFGVRFPEMRYTMHGFALNVSTNLQYFKDINPCGFKDKGAISIEQLLGNTPSLGSIIPIIAKQLASALDYNEYEMCMWNDKVLKAAVS